MQQIPYKMALLMWDEVVEEKFREKTSPQKIADGVLIVGVSSAAFRSQLTLKKALLLEQLNRLVKARGGQPVKDIKFTQTTQLSKRRRLISPPSLDPAPWLDIKLDEQEKREINKLAAKVKEPSLRSKIRYLLLRERQYRKYTQAQP